ncbi:hypothetical protein [Ralstonia pseudosolanacearum]|uniref:Uncharacterized protein n=2 Tax=Ralstonia TaxID=48736 RepID=A0A0S4VEI4_RALSL|nr:hypothetical protein [Ralstonia pseudosolanacearum]CUV25526.1 protein of unknown function [Ralstonia solanacearum]CUV33030.1 protein of unknown function [Ralstonia solanacearum]CUV41775.1 protein of unknown function [Ralstonia solanacearum]CUV62952.1 protein of unknown function [Ralstonia solanacearum]
MRVQNTGRGRLNGFLIYFAATATVIAIHALALHLDDASQDERRVHTAPRQA